MLQKASSSRDSGLRHGLFCQSDFHSHNVPVLVGTRGRNINMWEYPITRAFADARVQRIYGGTNEIMKEVIARSMGLPAN